MRILQVLFAGAAIFCALATVSSYGDGESPPPSPPTPGPTDEPETFESTLEYVGYVTFDMMRAALFPAGTDHRLSPVDDYDRLSILTELAALDYFERVSVEDRKTVIAEWEASSDWKSLVLSIEEGPGGAFQWLSWIPLQCSSDGSQCVIATPAQSREIAMVELDTNRVLMDYLGYMAPMIKTAITNCENFKLGNGAIDRVFVKSCWKSLDLDKLYWVVWRDLRHRRNRPGFGPEEIKRLKQYFDLTEKRFNEQADKALVELIKLEAEIAMWALPLEKVVSVPLKLGRYGVNALAANRATRALAGGIAIQKALTTERILHFSEGALNGALNVSRMFTKASIGVAVKVYGTELRNLIASYGPKAMNDLMRHPFTAPFYNPEFALTLTGNSSYHTAKNLQKILDGLSPGSKVDPIAFYDPVAKKVYFSEEAFRRSMIKEVSEHSLRAGFRATHVHEYVHAGSGAGILALGSGSYKFSVIKEGFTEYVTWRVAKTYGYADGIPLDRTPMAREFVDEFRSAIIRREKMAGWSVEQSEARADEVLQRIIYKSPTTQAVNEEMLNVLLNGSGNPPAGLAVSGANQWINDRFKAGQARSVIDYVKTLFR